MTRRSNGNGGAGYGCPWCADHRHARCIGFSACGPCSCAASGHRPDTATAAAMRLYVRGDLEGDTVEHLAEEWRDAEGDPRHRYVGTVVVEHETCGWCGHHVDVHDGTGINSGACSVEDCDCVRFEVPVRAEGTDHASSPTS